MFEGLVGAGAVVSAAVLAGLVDVITAAALTPSEGVVSDAERIDRIGQLERLTSACAALKARETSAFAESRLAGAGDSDPKRRQARRSVAAQIGLARRCSPTQAARHTGLAHVLVCEMPSTFASLARGELSEWRATLVARETMCLSREHRAAVDAELADRLAALGDVHTAREAARIAYRLDPQSAVQRHSKAVADRRVTIRPAPDTMSYVTALLPVTQGVAVFAALNAAAASATAVGDGGSRGQIMADEFVRRVCSPAATAIGDGTPAALPAGTGVEVSLVMTDRTLLDGDDEPALLPGYGAVPAPLARRLIAGAADDGAVWVRRLYTDPVTGLLTDADRKRRLFPAAAKRFLVSRDQCCRGPWCGAAIRHADHVTAVAAGGATTLANGQGGCENCNYLKEAPGWTSTPNPDGTILITTPTGHSYRSRPPDPPRSRPWSTERPPGHARRRRRGIVFVADINWPELTLG